MDIEMLLGALRILKNNSEIIGMDIVGDYSPMKFNSFFKGMISRHDHPDQRADEMERDEIIRINETTNVKILELFL